MPNTTLEKHGNIVALTSENVHTIMMDCLYSASEMKGGQVPEGTIIVEGIQGQVGFNPERIKESISSILDMLSFISNDFSSEEAGGTSFM